MHNFFRTLAPYSNEERTMSKFPTKAIGGSTGYYWAQHREASLNWLALGLLLAAWNSVDGDSPTQMRRRPPALRGYSYVSVRATMLHAAKIDSVSTQYLSESHKSVNQL
jgi:hypothetical protein